MRSQSPALTAAALRGIKALALHLEEDHETAVGEGLCGLSMPNQDERAAIDWAHKVTAWRAATNQRRNG